MKIRNSIFCVALIGLWAACAGGPAIPESPQNRAFPHVSGGIGLEEREEIEAQAKNYNLLITNANIKSQLTTGIDFAIRDDKGREILKIDDAGPLLYVQLPPGDYVISMAKDRQNEERKIKLLAKQTARLHLIWKDD
jgi:hypothetical protein